jgi:hypothetical protein
MSATVVPPRLELLIIPSWFPPIPGVIIPELGVPIDNPEKSAVGGREILVGCWEIDPAFFLGRVIFAEFRAIGGYPDADKKDPDNSIH